MPKTLRFGIESLDKLIGSNNGAYGLNIARRGEYGAEYKEESLTTSVCLIGPDGTGKSVLALHLAARYMADCYKEREDFRARHTGPGLATKLPHVLYISTDLTHSMAKTMWDNFDLSHPFRRQDPFATGTEEKFAPELLNVALELNETLPTDMHEILADERDPFQVCFVDLAQATAGDDWAFVHRMLSVLDPPKSSRPRHLVLLDAVEGFETLVGDLNTFGEKSTRRSRIAQVMRLASNKCHLLFVVEEARQERLPEEFVTDAVIRLRNIDTNGYVRRTVDIEKTRGQTHVRGQHPFVTRDGEGSTTGEKIFENYDDPQVLKKDERFRTTDIVAPDKLLGKLRDADNLLSKHLYRKLPAGTRRQLDKYDASVSPPELLQSALVAGLNRLLDGPCLFDKQGFEGVRLSDKARSLIARKPQGEKLVHLNRLLLEEAYPNEIGHDKQSYVQFFPSINYLSRELMKDREEPRMSPPKKFAGFGIPYLDTMLGGDGELRSVDGADTRGLPCSRVTALIGDALTQKSQLGHAFLSRTFYPFAKALARSVLHACPRYAGGEDWEPDADEQEAIAEFKKKVTVEVERLEAEVLEGPGDVSGVALMLTNYDTHSAELAKDFIKWLNPRGLLGSDAREEAVGHFAEALQDYIERNTICRRMEIHDLSSPVVTHIVQRNIEAAQRKLFPNEPSLPKISKRFNESWRIRLVIDDFNAFRNIFPEIHTDPLLLPFLLFHLGREGISTLIIDTQSGKPDLALAERFESSLREVADYRLYTWRIPFYGETRIAITAIPPLSLENRGLIRELASYEQADEDSTDRQLTVDPHFELYAGLERGIPHPVPLEVRLYPGTETLIKYITEENVLFKELFVPNAGKTDIIVGFDPPNYESFREFCYLQRDTRLDHTLVFQVDEFWLTWLTRQSRTRKAGVLQRQWPYLNTVTIDKNGEPERAADAYYLFQETFDDAENRNGQQAGQAGASRAGQDRECRRRDFYDDDLLGYGLKGEEIERAQRPYYEAIDRVPFLWDFSFLLCRENLWKEYIAAEQHLDKKGRRENVEEVWDAIPKAETVKQKPGGRKKKTRAAGKKGQTGEPDYKSWRRFLEACKEVAEYHSAKTSTPIPAFDFSMNDGESFSCLMLELWASETYDSKRKRDRSGKEAYKFAHFLSQRKWAKWQVDEETSLFKGLSADRLEVILRRKRDGADVGFSLELYKAWLLLTEVVDFTDLVSTPWDFSFDFKSRQSNPHAVAMHHWYQSACDLIDHHQLAENLVAVRLPGHFSVRGDWFLAAAGGSRSSRLAQRAMDLLSSRRANIKRLQLGIGLPVRKIVGSEEDFENVRTRLIATDETTGRLKNVSYKDFLRIRGRTKPGGKAEDKSPEEEFYWLWRSSHYGYARYSKVWQKWLNRMALWWHTIHTRHRSTWTPGFEVYDKINQYLYPEPGARVSKKDLARIEEDLNKYESWQCFHVMIDILLKELKQVSFGRNYSKEAGRD